MQGIQCKKWIVLLGCVMVSNFVRSQSVFGHWRTVDDETGEPKAIVDVYKQDGLMYGKIIKILSGEGQGSLCTKCKGDRKDKPLVGMTIIEALEKNADGEWKGDTLFDPEQGKAFKCKIWLNPDNPNELKVRGYLSFVYRTQTWIRAVE
ncbi:MAG: DUF2147 domain-containing protein [Bacteroidota bacterium]